MKFVRDECDNPMVWNEGLTMVGYIAPLHRGMLAGQVPQCTHSSLSSGCLWIACFRWIRLLSPWYEELGNDDGVGSTFESLLRAVVVPQVGSHDFARFHLRATIAYNTNKTKYHIEFPNTLSQKAFRCTYNT